MDPFSLFDSSRPPASSSKVAALFSEPTPSRITDLFDSAPATSTASVPTKGAPPLTRSQILKCFSTVPADHEKLTKATKDLLIFTEKSLMPEAILRPDMKIELFSAAPKLSKAAAPYIKKELKNRDHPPTHETKPTMRRGSENPHDDYNKSQAENISNNIAVLFGQPQLPVPLAEPKYEPRRVSMSDLFEEKIVPEPVKPKPKSENVFMEYAGTESEGDKVWYYKDLKGEVQGPFSSLEMKEWNKAGYFFKTLMISCRNKTDFHSLEDVLSGKAKFKTGKENEEPEAKHIDELFGGISVAKPAELIDSAIAEKVEAVAEKGVSPSNKFNALFQ